MTITRTDGCYPRTVAPLAMSERESIEKLQKRIAHPSIGHSIARERSYSRNHIISKIPPNLLYES